MAEYVIWSIEHQAWWPASRMGYVLTLAEAGRFSHVEATAIVARANYPPGTFHECMIPVEALHPGPAALRPDFHTGGDRWP